MMAPPPVRQVNRSGLGSMIGPTGSGASKRRIPCGTTTCLPAHLAYPTPHTRKTQPAIGSPAGSVQRGPPRIRPDRAMRQFDGSIV
jgi:hypothetical protein